LFPPSGTVYVPRELIPASFAHSHAAAWIVKDLGGASRAKDLAVSAKSASPGGAWGKKARFRATGGYVCPAELIRLPVASEDYSGVRTLLCAEGLSGDACLGSRRYLLEFADGKVAGPLDLSADAAGQPRYFCPETALANPLPAWPSRQGLDLIILEFGGR